MYNLLIWLLELSNKYKIAFRPPFDKVVNIIEKEFGFPDEKDISSRASQFYITRKEKAKKIKELQKKALDKI